MFWGNDMNQTNGETSGIPNESTQLPLLKSRYDPRFFKDYLGDGILTDRKTAIIELIANAWDAFATTVDIRWPNKATGQPFSITDNGSGMTEDEFEKRWMTLSYNRLDYQGKFADPPPSLSILNKRSVFGRNGKGRHAAFCFSENRFFVETAKDGQKILFEVWLSYTEDSPFHSRKVSSGKADYNGTRIFTDTIADVILTSEEIRSEIGMRFLNDPSFEVAVDGVKVTFDDIPEVHSELEVIDVPEVGNITIIAIDTKASDKTTKQHGIAWQVQGRLVGDSSWTSFDDQKFLDGRSTAAKRYTFIIKADPLVDYVNSDWSGFDLKKEAPQKVLQVANEYIKQFLLARTADQREATFSSIRDKNRPFIERMDKTDVEIWNTFVSKVQEECPSLNEKELDSVASLLAKLEASRSRYSLLERLDACSTDDLDKLDTILDDWSVETAKEVLDLLQVRLALVDELSRKVLDNETDEVQELQPLFQQGLWIFGPEFEAAGFTSNQALATIVREIFKKEGVQGSRNRPDFLITPNSSIGFYTYPAFHQDENHEIGIGKLVIVELKKPSVKIGSKEKEQCWKYVKELLEKGCIDASTRVDCYALGKTIDNLEGDTIKRGQGEHVRITPCRYDTIIDRAKSRTHLLFDKVRTAPFLNREKMERYIEADHYQQGNIFSHAASPKIR